MTLRPGFMTEERLRWLWRCYRAELIREGIAIVLGHRTYVHPARLDRFVLDYAQRLAAARVGMQTSEQQG